mmetsp:Transcript_839/g.1264  ORF Transcript_839/g.1264 Transcript_839/m.1264 type:complete len:153 (+) Transcript_839:203-661(+)
MATKADNDSRTIAHKLVTFLFSFYFLYYIFAVILVGGFHVGWSELGRFPYRISEHEFNPALGGGALGSWLAMVLTFIASFGLAFWVVRATRKTWDYLLTTSLVHFIICCGANRSFPVNWVWWVTLGVANILVAGLSEVLIYQLREQRDIELG